MSETTELRYNIPNCPGISPHPQCDSFPPIDSLRHLELCMNDFGEIHCKYACAFCESSPNVIEEEKYLYNQAFIELHKAFEYLPNGIMDDLIEKGGMDCPACAIAGGLSLFPIVAKYSRPRPISHEIIPGNQVPDTCDSFPCYRTTIEKFKSMPEHTESCKDIGALRTMGFRDFPALPPPFVSQAKHLIAPGRSVLVALFHFEEAFEADEKWKHAINDAEWALNDFIELKKKLPDDLAALLQKSIDRLSKEVADLKSGKIRERRKLAKVSLSDEAKCSHNRKHIDTAKRIKGKIWSTIMSKQQASCKMQIARTTLDDLLNKHLDDVIVLSPQRYRFNCLNPEFGMLAPDKEFNDTQGKCSQM